MATIKKDTSKAVSTDTPKSVSMGRPAPNNAAISSYTVPVQIQRLRQNVSLWRDAIREMEYAYFPYRVKAQQLYIDTELNGHVTACVERRKDLTLLRKFEFSNKAGEMDAATTELFTNTTNGKTQPKTWFTRFIGHALDAIFYGYSLIELGDVVNNEFPNIATTRRWLISPDRLQVTTFMYQPNGMKFMDEPFVNWHVWVPTSSDVGISNCGYGLYYKVAIYEIFMRNLLGFNGDFVELFAQPYRVGKTSKTDETERAEFAAVLQQMGSSGWAITDPVDTIEFLETAMAGTGYKGYDNFEKRLREFISKVMLGHADALDSTPGKLGSSDGEFSPGQKALEDKQTKDGVFIENIINDVLLPKLRALGFLIPDDVRFGYKNDAEVMQNANSVADIAVKIGNAGMQMDPDYFFQETGIKVIPKVVASPFGGPAPAGNKPDNLKPSARKKIEALYNDKHVHA